MSQHGHFEEEVLDRYLRNALPEHEAEDVEDHIALCPHCLDRLDEIKEFMEVMRRALSVPPPAPRKSWLAALWPASWPVSAPVWGMGALAAAALVFFLVRPPAALPPIATVVLQGTRGVSQTVHGTGPFDFELFMPEAATSYDLELLDASGAKQWQGTAAGANGKLHAIVNRRLSRGQYFLRVKEPGSGAIHEFGVNLQP